MGYFADGNPSRGEILVAKSFGMFPGYYNDAKRTEDAFVEIDGDRFYCTGDVGEMENGMVRMTNLMIIQKHF